MARSVCIRCGGNEVIALSERQVATLRMIADGETSHMIAATLGITNGAHVRDLKTLLDKLGARSRPHAVAEAMRLGLIE
jgi:DNA-binding CsgD family transcriptional regulator